VEAHPGRVLVKEYFNRAFCRRMYDDEALMIDCKRLIRHSRTTGTSGCQRYRLVFNN
jgi:hypothetical protein